MVLCQERSGGMGGFFSGREGDVPKLPICLSIQLIGADKGSARLLCCTKKHHICWYLEYVCIYSVLCRLSLSLPVGLFQQLLNGPP